MSLRTAFLASALAALALVATATGANNPGDPCTTEGAIADLSGGKVQCVGGTWRPLAPTGPAQPASPGASTVKTAAIFTAVGVALSAETFSSGGQQVADVTAVRPADGRVRLYAFVAPGGIQSAISTDATGTSFVAEPGRRITLAPGGQTRAYVLDDGRVRLFTSTAGA